MVLNHFSVKKQIFNLLITVNRELQNKSQNEIYPHFRYSQINTDQSGHKLTVDEYYLSHRENVMLLQPYPAFFSDKGLFKWTFWWKPCLFTIDISVSHALTLSINIAIRIMLKYKKCWETSPVSLHISVFVCLLPAGFSSSFVCWHVFDLTWLIWGERHCCLCAAILFW